MEFEDLIRLARRNWLPLLLLTLAGGLLGGFTAMSQPMVYTSTATTTVTTAAERFSVSDTYSIIQAIRVTMPAYLSESTGTAVIEAASDSSGISAQQIADNLTTTLEPDTTVIQWSMQSPSGESSQRTLAAAVSAFQDAVAQSAPTNASGRPLIDVRVDKTASYGQGSRAVSPALAGGAGALAGLGGGVLFGMYRLRGDRLIRSRESVELGLAIPVIAELTNEQGQHARAWAYVATYLAQLNVTEPVLVVTGRQPFNDQSLEMARAAMAATLGRSHQFLGALAVDDPKLQAAMLRAGAVALVLTKDVDDVAQLRPHVSSIASVSTGPVFALLDGRSTSQRLGNPSGPTKLRKREPQPNTWSWWDLAPTKGQQSQ